MADPLLCLCFYALSVTTLVNWAVLTRLLKASAVFSHYDTVIWILLNIVVIYLIRETVYSRYHTVFELVLLGSIQTISLASTLRKIKGDYRIVFSIQLVKSSNEVNQDDDDFAPKKERKQKRIKPKRVFIDRT